MEEEAGTKSTAFSATLWLPLADSIGGWAFLSRNLNLMKSLVRLPAVRFQAKDTYWQISNQHFLFGKFCFHVHILMTALSWRRVHSSYPSEEDVCVPCSWCLLLSGRGGHSVQEAERMNLFPFLLPILIIGDTLRQEFSSKARKKWGIIE